MGLQSALSTALTGLSAAETKIDVAGNNLANSQTVGFKQSDVQFATQLLQTLSLGSAPNANTGGTNPRQIGLGTQVAQVRPDFQQGTVEISSSPSDLALQGDGFFIVQGDSGEQLFTRNGIFNLNQNNELVSITGNRLLGFGTDGEFQIDSSQLRALEIPLGAMSVAQATQNVTLEGTLTATGDIADTAEVIESAVLGDGSIAAADASAALINTAPSPDTSSVAASSSPTGGSLPAGEEFEYRFAFADPLGSESVASDAVNVTVGAGDDTVTLGSLPASTENPPGIPEYSLLRIYRRTVGAPSGDPAADFRLLTELANGTASFDDTGAIAPTTQLDETALSGNYSYMITFHAGGQEESRPTPLLGPFNLASDRVHFRDLPTPPAPFTDIRVYRNLATDPGSFFLVDTVSPTDPFTDMQSDADISLNQQLDLDGPKATAGTLLVDVVQRDGLNYSNAFEEGALTFAGKKGGRTLADQTFQVTATSTVQELIDFMQDSMGIQAAGDDPQNPIPGSGNNIPGESGTLAAGGSVVNGRLRFVSNNGVDNALDIGAAAFEQTDSGGEVSIPFLGFGSVQQAQGQSAVADVIVFDTLGIPIQMRLTTILQERTSTETTYRWFADSADNDPATGAGISVGTGLISFDGEGNILSTSNTSVAVQRANVPSTSPLEFELDFSGVTGLAATNSTLSVNNQDGFPPGTLVNFAIGEDGVIRGAFSNGATRTLGQVRLARFNNAAGLEQRGENLFSIGPNSGLPIEGNPGQQGIGTILAGALELSNTDVGRNLIDLVLASTQFRGNSRVISAAQELFDELLNLRR